MYKKAIAVGVILAVAAVLASAHSRWQQVHSGQTIKVDVELTLVEATVKDKAGQILSGLKKEDFRVYEDGVEQEIAHFSQDQIPLAVALVVDQSGSIKPFLRPLRYATVSALKALKGEDRVTLFTFTNNVKRRVDLTLDKTAVSEEMENVTAGGGTNINDAVYQAAKYLAAEAPAARRVIIVVSDNVPSTSGSVNPAGILRAALEADLAVYGVKIPGRNPPGVKITNAFARGRVSMTKLAEQTGGEIFDVKQEASLYPSFKAVIERLKTRYTLGYYPASKGTRGAYHALDVQLQKSRGANGRDYVVVHKKGYYGKGR